MLISLSLDISNVRLLRLLTTPDSPSASTASVTLLSPDVLASEGASTLLPSAVSVSSAYGELMGVSVGSDEAGDLPEALSLDGSRSFCGWEDMGSVGGISLILAPVPPSSTDDAAPPKVVMVDDVRIILSESSRSVFCVVLLLGTLLPESAHYGRLCFLQSITIQFDTNREL
jgi:hypothetical protein